MAHKIFTIKKRSTFVMIRNEGKFVKSKNMNVQILHNHVTVHSRTAYEDWPEPERKRHLLRLWLATPSGRPLPPAYEERYGGLKTGDRPAGGIIVPGTVLKAPLYAE